MVRRLKTVGLIARDAGVAMLEGALLSNPSLDMVAVAAHRRLPRVEDPSRGDRPEFAAIQRACSAANIPLFEADTPEMAKDLDFVAAFGEIDILCCVSWRYILSPKGLARPRLGAINLHRGKLPAYAGAEPVRRMIEAKEPDAVITAHLMVNEVDAGPTLATVHLPMGEAAATLALHVELTKARLVPLYAPLLRLAIEALVERSRA